VGPGASAITEGRGGAGGGSGRLIFSSTTVSKSLAYTITIGAGGAASTGGASPGNSSFFGLIESNGGAIPFQSIVTRPSLGGSLGGNGNTTGTAGYQLNVVTTPVPVFMQINSADNFYYSLASVGGFRAVNNVSGGAGGGGAGGWGFALTTGGGSGGGSGFAVSTVGSSVFYASGGDARTGTVGTASGVAGTANTGNGGSSASILASPPLDTYLGGNGGSGVVIIAYRDTYPAPTSITGTYDQPTRTGYRVYRFTGSGSITF
jgi:hypothetical protein